MFFSSYEILSLFPERLFQFNSFAKISFFSPEHPPPPTKKQNKTKQNKKEKEVILEPSVLRHIAHCLETSFVNVTSP